MDTRELTQVPPQIIELARQIREAAGDDDAAFVDTLDGEVDHIRAARAAVRFIQERTAMADALDAVIRSYQARKDGLLGGVLKTREALAHFLSEIGEKSLQLPEATITLANARPSLTGDCDPWTLPDDLYRTIRQPNRQAIKEALQSGREVPGYAMSNGKPSLRITGGKSE